MSGTGGLGPPDAAAAGRRNVRWVLAGQSASLLGDYVSLLALPLFVVYLTGSALDLGLTTALETVPTLLFGFAVGVLLDRVNLRRLLVIADLARAAAFLALGLASAAGGAEVWMVFVVAFLVGTLTVTFDSGFQAWLPALAPDDALVVVNSRLQFARSLAWTLGPPLAGYLAAIAGGFRLAFGLNAATFVVSAASLLVLVEIRPRPAPTRDPWLVSFRQGMSCLWRLPALRVTTLAGTAANLVFVPMESLLVLFCREQLGLTDSAYIGWFFGGHSLLGACGVVAAPVLARRLGLGRTFVLGLAAMGAGFLALALAAPALAGLTPLLTTVLAILPAGVAVTGVSFLNVAFTTMRQQLPPPELRGRVIAASRTLAWAGLPLGAVLGGAAGQAFGLPAVYAGASAAIVAMSLALTATGLWGRRAAAEGPAA
ncbi:MAG: major facilitator superfamily 1 [Actinobacteria bacterium]|nr:major facilitator superfamily 1 [Actinomycetota bacterium]